MPPRIWPPQLLQSFRSTPRSTDVARRAEHLCLRLQSRRHITANEKPLPAADGQKSGPNQDPLPHVSEEADALGKITGTGGPDIDQGTPVQDVRNPSVLLR